MSKPLAPCGTYAAYQRHLRRAEPIDPECRKAQAVYQATWRAANPKQRDRERAVTRAASRALWLLKADHPAEFAAYYAQQVAKEQRYFVVDGKATP